MRRTNADARPSSLIVRGVYSVVRRCFHRSTSFSKLGDRAMRRPGDVGILECRASVHSTLQ